MKHTESQLKLDKRSKYKDKNYSFYMKQYKRTSL